jgi:hypothetical protein
MALEVNEIIADNLTGSTVNITSLVTPTGTIGDVKTALDSKLEILTFVDGSNFYTIFDLYKNGVLVDRKKVLAYK